MLSNSQIAKQIKEKRSLNGFDDESYQEEKDETMKASQRKKSKQASFHVITCIQSGL